MADAFATFFEAMGRVETGLASTRSEQAELVRRFAELTDSVIGLANRVNEIEQNAKERAEASAKERAEASAKENSPAPVDAALSPDSLQRIAQIASELRTVNQAAMQAAPTTLTETANEPMEKIAGALADLVRLETNRVLLDNQSVAASTSHSDAGRPDTGHSDTGHTAAGTPAAGTPTAATPGTGHMAAGTPAAGTPAAESPTSPARSFAPPAKPGEEPEPLTLDSLDDPFLEALIKSDPLAD